MYCQTTLELLLLPNGISGSFPVPGVAMRYIVYIRYFLSQFEIKRERNILNVDIEITNIIQKTALFKSQFGNYLDTDIFRIVHWILL